MTSTELITPPRASCPPEPWSGAHPASSADLTADDVFEETSALVGVVPFYGPPVVLLAAPWLFLSLILAGPFAVLVTLVLAVLVAAALVALACAILASPYLLVRGVRGYRASHRPLRSRVAKPVGFDSPRVAT
jgi:hypothetical protein